MAQETAEFRLIGRVTRTKGCRWRFAAIFVRSTVVGVSRYSPIIGAFNASNVSVLGGGEIDGQGAAWYAACAAHKLVQGRPRLVEFNTCVGVRMDDLTLRDSPFWTVHPVYSRSVHISRLRIFAPTNGLGNTDGVNPDSSVDVVIEDCFIANGDDGIAIKSGKVRHPPR